MATNLVTEATAATQRSGFYRFWSTLKQLFHELVGAVFAVLAFAWVQSAIRAWTRDVAHWLVATAFAVAVVMGIFSWTSFRRARKLERQAQ
jgi:ABC-type Fe3+ transport system permease subunit